VPQTSEGTGMSKVENYTSTNDSNVPDIQPVRKWENSRPIYVFNDDEIRSELENYHVREEKTCESFSVEQDESPRRSLE